MRNQFSTNCSSDTLIWNSFKNGDKAAFATLYYRYFGILMHNCFRYSKDTRIIEDCIQDLFLEIWNNKLNLVTPASVKAYLLCSTQRKVLRQVKRNRNFAIPAEHAATTASIEDNMISEQLRLENNIRLSRAIDKLTKRQKQAVSLRYYENRSYADIAAIMTISTDAVYNLVSKALDNIQKCLQPTTRVQPTYLN